MPQSLWVIYSPIGRTKFYSSIDALSDFMGEIGTKYCVLSSTSSSWEYPTILSMI